MPRTHALIASSRSGSSASVVAARAYASAPPAVAKPPTGPKDNKAPNRLGKGPNSQSRRDGAEGGGGKGGSNPQASSSSSSLPKRPFHVGSVLPTFRPAPRSQPGAQQKQTSLIDRLKTAAQRAEQATATATAIPSPFRPPVRQLAPPPSIPSLEDGSLESEVAHAEEEALSESAQPKTGAELLAAEEVANRRDQERLRHGDDASLVQLERILLSERAHPAYGLAWSDKERADRVWELYGEVQQLHRLPVGMWSTLLEAVAPSAFASANLGPRNIGTSAERANRTLTNYLRSEVDGRFERVLKDMVSVGLQPGLLDYRTVINHFASSGFVKGTEATFKALVDAGFKPRPEDYTVRLRSICHWLRRYESLEAKMLIEQGLLHPYQHALDAVPPLVEEIMTALEAEQFAPVFPRQAVALACELFAKTGDFKAFNRLARWEYGVDLDFPDAIPEEFLERVRTEQPPPRRSISPTALRSMLYLLGSEGDLYRMLSTFEVVAYPPPLPTEGHMSAIQPILDYSTDELGWRSEDGTLFAPPLPPTTALALMNVEKVEIAVQHPIQLVEDDAAADVGSLDPSSPPLPSSSSPSPSSSSALNHLPTTASQTTSSSFSSSTSPSTKYTTTTQTVHRLSPREFRSPRPIKDALHRTVFDALLHPISTSHDLFLGRHILTLGLANHYAHRQPRSGLLMRYLSHPVENRDARAEDRQRFTKNDELPRVRWFIAVSEACVRTPGREAFETMKWIESEARLWKATLQMDLGLVERAIEAARDDDGRAEGRNAAWRSTYRNRSDWDPVSLENERVLFRREIGVFHSVAWRLLGHRLAALAWRDVKHLHRLLNEGSVDYATVLSDGSTVGARLDEYTVVLAERLTTELRPVPSGFDSITQEPRFTRSEADFRALYEADANARAFTNPIAEAEAVDVDLGIKHELRRTLDCPFDRHQIATPTIYGMWPSVSYSPLLGYGVEREFTTAGGAEEGGRVMQAVRESMTWDADLASWRRGELASKGRQLEEVGGGYAA